MTTLLITTLLPIKPTEEEVRAMFSPLNVLSITTKTELTGEVEVAEDITQEQASALAEGISAYLLSRIFTITLPPPPPPE